MPLTLYLLTAAALLGIAHLCVARLSRGAALALLLPVAASFGFTASIAFFLAALGTFLLARELHCSEMAAVIAAAAFTLSAPIALQILWPLGFAWALLPLVLLATRRVIDAPSI